MRRGFTLVELLVVVTIIGLITVVSLPVVLPAYNHREVSGAGRILQGAIVGARDRAIHLDRPCGLRLLPDPAFPLTHVNGQLDPAAILAYNRIVPLESAPDYTEGRCCAVPRAALIPGGSFPIAIAPNLSFTWASPPTLAAAALVLVESPFDPATGAPNAPTSWFWNIRVGDRVQLNGAGDWYTVIGPMTDAPGSGSNSEMFVNVGKPAPLGNYANILPAINGQPVEYLLLVNSVDDNRNGFPDEGFDGCDNNNNGLVDLDDRLEWVYNTVTLPTTPPTVLIFGESESWLGSVASRGAVNVPYTIRRRPAPSQGAREVALPSSMVIDATTWGTSRERSRLPVNPFTGYVDILIRPDGTVLPASIYSSPSSFGMDSAFFHFWLAERQDLAAPGAAGLPASAPYALPIANPGTGSNSTALPGPYLKGEYSVLSLSARSGNLAVNQAPPFLFDLGTSQVPGIGYNAQRGAWNASNPFIPAEQGAH